MIFPSAESRQPCCATWNWKECASRSRRASRRWLESAKPTAADVLALCDKRTLDLVASFQRAVVEDLVGKTLQAAQERDARTLFVTGGVAANRELRETFALQAAKADWRFIFRHENFLLTTRP